MLLDVLRCRSIAIGERLSLRAFHQGFVKRAHSLQLRFLLCTRLALSATTSPMGQISCPYQALRAGLYESTVTKS
jgi:hypothetical protein